MVGSGNSLWTSLIVPTVSVDIPNNSYSLRERLEWALYTVSVDIPNSSDVFVDVLNSPYGLCGRP